jgi:pimeloyl-ACP methyl ester carboxylesterase
MKAMVEGAGVELSYREHGTGSSVLVIHGLAGDGKAWEPFARRLEHEARVISYDRRGYGDSGAPAPYERTTVYEQTEDALELVRSLEAAPALVCGDGFGALVALDLAIRHPASVRGVVLADPPLYAFIPAATEVLGREREGLRDALRDRGPEAAVEEWLAGRAEGEALTRARAAHRAFFADFAGLSTWPVTRAELRAVALPAVIVTGVDAPPHILAAADALAGLLPHAGRCADGDVEGAVRSLLG